MLQRYNDINKNKNKIMDTFFPKLDIIVVGEEVDNNIII